MAVSTFFNEELAEVDATKSFTYVLDTSGHTENEYTVSGWTVTGGSEAAQAHGAARALYDMGFRHYSPQRTYRPASVPSGGATIAKREDAIPHTNMFLNYDFSPFVADDDIASAAFQRWRQLNCLNTSRRTVGQSWPGIIAGINAQDNFFTNNPSYLIGAHLFNIDGGAIESAVVDRVGTYIGQSLVASGETFYPFGVSDGVGYLTADLIRFTTAVSEKAREAVPSALLGYLAYGSTAVPPTDPCPDLYVQVTLGFTSAGLGYPELVRQWGLKAGGLGLRAYGDIGVWRGWMPMSAGVGEANYWTTQHPLQDYIANGVDSINLETSANFAKNIVNHYHTVRFWRDGMSDHGDVVDEVVTNIYDGDANVHDLFTLWGGVRASRPRMLESCAIIDAMPDTWYRNELRQLMTISLQHSRTETDLVTHSPPYFMALEKNLRWWSGLRDGGFHAYVFERQMAHPASNVLARPDLGYAAAPHYQRYSVAPTDADYTAQRDYLSNLLTATLPDEIANQDDLVVVDVMPSGLAGDASTPVSTKLYSGTRGTFYALGPGTLTIETLDGVVSTEVIDLGFGLHQFTPEGRFTAELSTGLLWLDAYTGISLNYAEWPFAPRQPYWVYAPALVRGKTSFTCSTRLVLNGPNRTSYHSVARPPFNLTPNPDPTKLDPGVHKVNTSLVVGSLFLGNLNRYLSLHPRKMLMPRALAKLEFPSVSFGDAA